MINANSKLAENYWKNGKLDCPVIDFHAHMHEIASLYFPYTDETNMARTMDECGTRWTLFCSHLALYDPLEGESVQKKAVHKYPDYFKAYHGVISLYADPEKDIQEIIDNPDVYVGCKFFCDYNRTPLTSPIHTPYFEFLNENKLLVLLHTWGGSQYNGADHVAEVAAKYPNITFICGHSFCDGFEYAHSCLAGLSNIYYELTAVPIYRGFIEEICEKAGSDRLLFGSDMPWFSTKQTIGCVLSADLTDDDRENIFWRNGSKILNRFDWFNMNPRGEILR